MDDFGPRTANLARIFVVWAVSIAALAEYGFFKVTEVPGIFYMQALLALVGVILCVATARDISLIRAHCRGWGEVAMLVSYVFFEGVTAAFFVQAVLRRSVEHGAAFVALYLVLLVVGEIGPTAVTRHASYVESRLCGTEEV